MVTSEGLSVQVVAGVEKPAQQTHRAQNQNNPEYVCSARNPGVLSYHRTLSKRWNFIEKPDRSAQRTPFRRVSAKLY